MTWAKLNELQVREIFDLSQKGDTSQKQIADKYNVSPAAINLIVKGKNWAYLNLLKGGDANERK